MNTLSYNDKMRLVEMIFTRLQSSDVILDNDEHFELVSEAVDEMLDAIEERI